MKKINKNWGRTIPLRKIQVDDINAEGFPNWIKDYLHSISELTQTPLDFSVLLSLSALSTALAKKAKVEIKTGYREPLNIWVAAVSKPASRKSSAFGKIFKPIIDFEQDLKVKDRLKINKIEIEIDILKKQYSDLIYKLKNCNDEAEKDLLFNKVIKIKNKISRLKKEEVTSIIVTDITPERLAKKMQNNNGRMAVISPEADPLKIIAGRYSSSSFSNSETYKKAWTGGEPISDDRVSRESTYIKDPALTLAITIQNSILEKIKNKNDGELVEDGLIGRFLFGSPQSMVGHRKSGSDVPEGDTEAMQKYEKGIRLLLESKPKSIINNEWQPHLLKLSKEALKIRNNFDDFVEDLLAEGKKLEELRDWGGKLVGNIIRVAALIHVANQVDFAKEDKSDFFSSPVSAEAMKTAVELGKRLISHALKVYNVIMENPKYLLSKYVLKKIKKGKELEANNSLPMSKEKLDMASLLEICKGKKKIEKPNDLKRIVKILEEHNFVKLKAKNYSGRGRKPSALIELNPAIDSNQAK